MRIIALMMLGTALLAGCNTVEGAGRDVKGAGAAVESAGEAIADTANDVKKKITN